MTNNQKKKKYIIPAIALMLALFVGASTIWGIFTQPAIPQAASNNVTINDNDVPLVNAPQDLDEANMNNINSPAPGLTSGVDNALTPTVNTTASIVPTTDVTTNNDDNSDNNGNTNDDNSDNNDNTNDDNSDNNDNTNDDNSDNNDNGDNNDNNDNNDNGDNNDNNDNGDNSDHNGNTNDDNSDHNGNANDDNSDHNGNTNDDNSDHNGNANDDNSDHNGNTNDDNSDHNGNANDDNNDNGDNNDNDNNDNGDNNDNNDNGDNNDNDDNGGSDEELSNWDKVMAAANRIADGYRLCTTDNERRAYLGINNNNFSNDSFRALLVKELGSDTMLVYDEDPSVYIQVYFILNNDGSRSRTPVLYLSKTNVITAGSGEKWKAFSVYVPDTDTWYYSQKKKPNQSPDTEYFITLNGASIANMTMDQFIAALEADAKWSAER